MPYIRNAYDRHGFVGVFVFWGTFLIGKRSGGTEGRAGQIRPTFVRISGTNRLRLADALSETEGEIAATFYDTRRARSRDPPCLEPCLREVRIQSA